MGWSGGTSVPVEQGVTYYKKSPKHIPFAYEICLVYIECTCEPVVVELDAVELSVSYTAVGVVLLVLVVEDVCPADDVVEEMSSLLRVDGSFDPLVLSWLHLQWLAGQ